MQRQLKIVLVCALLALLPTLEACAFVDLTAIDLAPTFLPIDAELPMDLSREGTTAETTFRIWMEDLYRLRLDLSGGREVSKYVGGCASVPVHFLLVRMDGQSDEVIKDRNLDLGGDGCVPPGCAPPGCAFAHFRLKPGRYRIRITNLKEHPQLQYVPAKFSVKYCCGKK